MIIICIYVNVLIHALPFITLEKNIEKYESQLKIIPCGWTSNTKQQLGNHQPVVGSPWGPEPAPSSAIGAPGSNGASCWVDDAGPF